MMKFLKKSRLNIFDTLVIIIVIAIIGTLFWFRISRKTEWINIRMLISNDEWWWDSAPPQWWYVDELQNGLTAQNSFGEKTAVLSNVEVFDIGTYRRRAYVDIKLKGSFDKNRQLYLYNFQPLQIGKPLDLTFGKNNVKGLVIYINKGEVTYQNRRIEVKIFKIRALEAESLVRGLEMKDSLGRILASIDDVQISPSLEYVFSDIRGQNVAVTNPLYRDVTLQLTIKTFISANSEHFMDRSAIKVGEKIWFQFPKTVIRDAEISKIIE